MRPPVCHWPPRLLDNDPAKMNVTKAIRVTSAFINVSHVCWHLLLTYPSYPMPFNIQKVLMLLLMMLAYDAASTAVAASSAASNADAVFAPASDADSSVSASAILAPTSYSCFASKTLA